MTTEQVRIDPKIAAHVDAALAAGFTIYAAPGSDPRPAGWVAVCLTEDGPFAHIQQPTMALDPVELDVPVTPHKDWGSGVKVDHDGTPTDAVRALRQACTEWDVTVRFMTRQYIAKHGTPKVRNQGRKCIDRWSEAVKLGERGTNWTVPQLAGRLEVGDRFEFGWDDGRNPGTLTVKRRKYGYSNGEEFVILTTEELDHTIEVRQRAIVTLLGAA